jgi:maltooligosyltrehalose trehalohydrolase
MADQTGTNSGWGPQWLDDNRVQFRLWAPEAEPLELVVNEARYPMNAVGDGWFEADVPGLQGGAMYRFRLPDGSEVIDPAAHFQPEGLKAPSQFVDHRRYSWQTEDWTCFPWEEAVVSEIHIGTFTKEGTFAAAIERLPHLADTGINALEVLPIAHFPGARGWGYDGVLHYAPHSSYGSPDDVKAFVDVAHANGIAVYLDVVYNHFGPEENYLPHYAPGFFHTERETPWGVALDFTKEPVRRYFVDNALHWLEHYRFDGLRLDATHEIYDASEKHVLVEIVREVRARFPDRRIHLIAEGQRHRWGMVGYRAGLPLLYDAGWNDHFHQALNVIVTGETGGYYADFAKEPEKGLALAMEGRRPESRSPREMVPEADYAEAHWPPQAFMNFLQNHDQVGNRAFGDRLWTRIDPSMARILAALLLLSPQIPLLFMGDEYGETNPFMFFADYGGELGEAVRNGRRDEAANFGSIAPDDQETVLPDPLSTETFDASKLNWDLATSTQGQERLALHRQLIALRRKHIIPLLAAREPVSATVLEAENGRLAIDWQFVQAKLQLRATLKTSPGSLPAATGNVIWFERSETVADGPEILFAIGTAEGEVG